jgi:hypothetical protein
MNISIAHRYETVKNFSGHKKKSRFSARQILRSISSLRLPREWPRQDLMHTHTHTHTHTHSLWPLHWSPQQTVWYTFYRTLLHLRKAAGNKQTGKVPKQAKERWGLTWQAVSKLVLTAQAVSPRTNTQAPNPQSFFCDKCWNTPLSFP